IIPNLLLPFLMIFMFVIAGWSAIAFIPPKHPQNIISGCIKITTVWFLVRSILLLAQRHFVAYFVSCVMMAITLLSVTGLLAPTTAFLTEITFETANYQISLLDVTKGGFTLIMLFWGAGVVSKTAETWLRKSNLSFNARELAIKFLRISLYFIAFVMTLNQIGVDLTALTVFGGMLAVGIGFGLQKIASNFISGIVLLFERTIEAGDLIEIGSEKGWVREMAIRHTLIETFDGREILIPNEDLITSKVTNWTYTNNKARVDINLSITYDSDADIALKLLLDAVKSSKKYINNPPPAAYLKEFNDRGMQLILVFWISDIKEGITPIKSEVMLKIVKSFAESGILFAVSGK
ncbi:MAG: mechanosensitive ion channel domain-containing protein, partial [Pseudomonadota bacterium]